MNDSDIKNFSRFSLGDLFFNLCALLVYGANISPVLRSGFIADDRFDTVWASVRSSKGISAYTDGLYWTEIFQNSLGRWHPLAHISGSLAFEINSRAAFKTLGFSLTLLSVALIGIGLNLLLNSRVIGGLFVLTLTVFHQFRPTFDPILSFGIHTKLLMVFLGSFLVALGMVKRYTGLVRVAAYVLLNLVCLAMCTYHELAIAMLVAALLLCEFLNYRHRLFLRLNLLLWVGIYFIVRLYLYSAIDPGDNPLYYQVDLSPLAFVQQYFVQLSGLVPFAQLTHFESLELVPNFVEICGAVLVILSVSYFFRRKNFTSDQSVFSYGSSSPSVKTMIRFGVLLIVIPPSFTSVSSGMQKWSRPWDGYLQVWIGEIGLAVIVAAMLNCHIKSVSKSDMRRVGLGFLFGTLILLTGMANRNTVDNNPYWETNTSAMGWSRSISENAVKSGILERNFSASDVIAFPARPWLVNDYINVLNQRSAQIKNEWLRFADPPFVLFRDCKIRSGLKSAEFSCGGSTENGFFVYARSFQDGFAILAQPISISASKNLSDQQQQIGEVVEVRNGFIFISRDHVCRIVKAKTLNGLSVEVTLDRTDSQGIFHFYGNDNFVAESIDSKSCLP